MSYSGSVTSETRLSRADILHAPVGTEETVMMSLEAGKYYGLNSVATHVWGLLETPKTVAELCRGVCAEFEVDAQTCEADVLAFVNELLANGVVHAASA